MNQSIVQIINSPRENDFNIFRIGAVTSSEERTITAVEDLGMIPQQVPCPVCGPNKILWKQDDRGSKLMFRWTCSTCRFFGRIWKFSPIANTFFSSINLTFSTTFRLIYCWFEKMPVTTATYHCQVTKTTAIGVYKRLHHLCLTVSQHDSISIGGNGDIVKVDESHLFTRKYPRRVLRRQMWVFGGICRRTKKVFVNLIPNKKKDTLWSIMQQKIAQETFVMSDQHRSYIGCTMLGFKGHASVNHSQNFVRPTRERIVDIHQDIIGFDEGPDPTPGLRIKRVKVHTNKLERLWREVKGQVRTVENGQMLSGYLGEFLYRHNVLRDLPNQGRRFHCFINDLIRVYPGLDQNGIKSDIGICQCNYCNESNISIVHEVIIK